MQIAKIQNNFPFHLQKRRSCTNLLTLNTLLDKKNNLHTLILNEKAKVQKLI